MLLQLRPSRARRPVPAPAHPPIAPIPIGGLTLGEIVGHVSPFLACFFACVRRGDPFWARPAIAETASDRKRGGDREIDCQDWVGNDARARNTHTHHRSGCDLALPASLPACLGVRARDLSMPAERASPGDLESPPRGLGSGAFASYALSLCPRVTSEAGGATNERRAVSSMRQGDAINSGQVPCLKSTALPPHGAADTISTSLWHLRAAPPYGPNSLRW